MILILVAVLLAVYGIIEIVRGEPVLGVILLLLACLIGPGGYSIFR